MPDAIQSLCEAGQSALLVTDYLQAEKFLAAAEALAWSAKDYDALARLYMPLQEARRQRRQFAGDGQFLSVIGRAAGDVSGADVLGRVARGQVVLAAVGSIGPALALRALANARNVCLDVPLAASYEAGGQRVVLFVPLPDSPVPPAVAYDAIDDLLAAAPPHAIATPADALPPDTTPGDARTFGYSMTVWEALHAPFLAAADAETDPVKQLAAYRRTIAVDYACEFAHQRLSDTARGLARLVPSPGTPGEG